MSADKARALVFVREVSGNADLPQEIALLADAVRLKLENDQWDVVDSLDELSALSRAAHSASLLISQFHRSTAQRPAACPSPLSSTQALAEGHEAAAEDSALANKKKRARAVLEGLACGDSLGAVSEFKVPWHVTSQVIDPHAPWPCEMVSAFGWAAGAPTDDTDMAMCVAQSVGRGGAFSPVAAAKEFLVWLRTGPADVGNTTRISLEYLSMDEDFTIRGKYWVGARKYWLRTASQANGGIMRNGPIAALMTPSGADEAAIITATVQQCIITHYAPMPVLCCVVHSLLIHRALRAEPGAAPAPSIGLIRELLAGPWSSWKASVSDEGCKVWLEDVQGHGQLGPAERELVEKLEGFEDLDPYHAMYRGISGWALLTLRISLWALHWALERRAPSCGIPHWLPAWPFVSPEFGGVDAALRWVVLIGADADTYAAVAGALLGAHIPAVPKRWAEQVHVVPAIAQIVDSCLC